MKFDAYAILAELRTAGGKVATCATCATPPPGTPSGVAVVARVARRKALEVEIRKTDPKTQAPTPSEQTEARPHGTPVTGSPMNLTGRVVSLDAYRRLSEQDRNGPNGRHWNGNSRRWEHKE